MKLITVIIVGSTNKSIMDFAVATTIRYTPHIENVVIFDDKKLRPNFNLKDYNFFCLKNMWAFVKTEFALVIQYDGMAANRNAWSEDFLNYDYIGAPWPDRFNWIRKDEKVGNGGFSLRSAKLLESLRDPIIQPNIDFTSSIEDRRFSNEDASIGQGYSKYLRNKHGIKFASVELANTFSHEWCNPTGETFGFHGMWNFPLFFDEDTVIEHLLDIPKNYWYNDKYEMLIENCHKRGYKKVLDTICPTIK